MTTSVMAAENQEQAPLPLPHGSDELFELIADGVSLLKYSDVKHKLLQWCVVNLYM